MTNKNTHPFRIRARASDGKPLDKSALNKLMSNQLQMPYIRFLISEPKSEVIFYAVKVDHIDALRSKLASTGLAVIEGETRLPTDEVPVTSANGKASPGEPSDQTAQLAASSPPTDVGTPLKAKPYGFVPLPETIKSDRPIWHDGSSSNGKLSGEIRCELTNLTPLLVGWERAVRGKNTGDWELPAQLNNALTLAENKSVLCPLRAPWGNQPVIIPADTLKGLLRHELGALLGAPMERVDERSYSYRPNMKFPDAPNGRRLEPRLARIRSAGEILVKGKRYPIPKSVDVLSFARRNQQDYGFGVGKPGSANEPYRGGLGAGSPLPDDAVPEGVRGRPVHTSISFRNLLVSKSGATIGAEAAVQYQETLIHLLDTSTGHFSSRHPQVGNDRDAQKEASDTVNDGAASAFKVGDIIWVEWDTNRNRIVSFGWNYYYRWAYADTVRRVGGKLERFGLFPLESEKTSDAEGAPAELSFVRRLFGYTGDNEGSKGIGDKDHSQLMGRVSINAALEVVSNNDTDRTRFLRETFLKELGMPRPSAVEHYLKQPHHPGERESDAAALRTYGDAPGYDVPGELAGRKFYLDRADAYRGSPWEDVSNENRRNERSTLAVQASAPNRRFRFTVRFRDLERRELAAMLVALCPDQFSRVLGGTHSHGYCSKLGYARPLGWGSVTIRAASLLLLNENYEMPGFRELDGLHDWVTQNHVKTPVESEWLAVHRRQHPGAGDYPRAGAAAGPAGGEIFTYHTNLRSNHTRNRRYRKGARP